MKATFSNIKALSTLKTPGSQVSFHLNVAKETLELSLRALVLLAFIPGNSSIEPLLEGLSAQIHIDLS